ncbi:MAG: hypothetical protein IJH99_04210 [Eubacterium sp.]|nr:hypothetical protein [Eubacterium sp.]
MKMRMFSVLLLAAAVVLGACGKGGGKDGPVTAAGLSEMDGLAIDKEQEGAAVHVVVHIPSVDSLRTVTLVPDSTKAEQLGLAMDEDGYVDYEHYMILREGVWQDAVPPNCMFAGEGEQSVQFGYISDIQAEGVGVSPAEAAVETEAFLQDLTGRSFQTYRVVTSNPLKEGETGEYWIWLMLERAGIPVLEKETAGVVAKYSPQGVYAYYGRFLYREEEEEAIDSYADPAVIADRFLAGGFGRCERCELVYITDTDGTGTETETRLIPAWAFYVQEEKSLKAYLYSAKDGYLTDVRMLEFLW